MEPRIQYAQTKDGVSIAFWTLGAGMPLVHMPSAPYNPTLRVWNTPEGRRWCERLAEKRKFVRYDNRGFGHSERDVTDFSLDALIMDLDAVVDRVAPEKVALFGYIQSGPVAIAYAARHPERVSHLVLWCTSVRGSDFFESDAQHEVMSELAQKDWTYFTESFAQSPFGWSASEEARQYAAYLRESATPAALRAAWDAGFKVDVADLMSAVTSPTLVLQRRGVTSPGMNVAHGLAARIPDARLAVLEGELLVPYDHDMDETIGIIAEFLGESPKAEPEGGAAPSGLVTILFTDMESSTALTQRLGDAKAQELVRTHNTVVRDALKSHAGSEIKHTGDGIMASFATASGAIECAITIQRAVAAHVEQHADSPLGVHIGLNAGEPVAEEADLFGTAVQLARRICDHAEAGQVLVSNVVRELAAGKSFMFSDIGEVVPKGFDEGVRLYEVRWQAEG